MPYIPFKYAFNSMIIATITEVRISGSASSRLAGEELGREN